MRGKYTDVLGRKGEEGSEVKKMVRGSEVKQMEGGTNKQTLALLELLTEPTC